MARGRRPGPPTQRPNGHWYAHHPGLKRPIRLAATTFAEAVAEQQSFYGVASAPAEVSTPIPGDTVPSSGDVGGTAVLNLDDEVTSEPKKTDSAADLLSSWAKSTTPMATQPTLVDTPAAKPAPLAGPPATVPTPAGKVPSPRVQKGLTPEQSAKIASGLKKMVVNTNVVVVASAVQMFGRVPAPLDDDEIALLQMGWEMWLDELFLKAKLKPIHLVIVGNLMIAVSMWAAGKPKDKPNPKTDATTAKAAPGHGSITPINPPKG